MHGFTGHPVRTWSHKKLLCKNSSEHFTDDSERPAKIPRLSSLKPFRAKENREHIYWPKHLIPKSFPTARVLVYGYDTHVRNSLISPPCKNTVYDIAKELLGSLEAERRPQPSRPILFVAHSLGGIVVKETLRQSHGYERHHEHLRQIYESTAAILFFGTPHGGADPRGPLAHIIERAAKAFGFAVNKQIVATLLPDSERLTELRDSFAPMAHDKNWIIYSFQEQYVVQCLGNRKGRAPH